MKKALVTIDGRDLAYISRAYALAGKQEVSGVAHVERRGTTLHIHSPELLTQVNTAASTDFKHHLDAWIQSWVPTEEYSKPMPTVDFAWWHKHPCTGWSGTDEQFIENYASAGLLVSIVMQSNDKFAARVDTILPGYDDRTLKIEADLQVLTPEYAEMEKRAEEHYNERVSSLRTTSTKTVWEWDTNEEGGFFQRLPGPYRDYPVDEDPPRTRGVFNSAMTPAQVKSLKLFLGTAKNRGLYFSKTGGHVTLFAGGLSLNTITIGKREYGAFRSIGVPPKTMKRCMGSGVFLKQTAAGQWVPVTLGGRKR